MFSSLRLSRLSLVFAIAYIALSGTILSRSTNRDLEQALLPFLAEMRDVTVVISFFYFLVATGFWLISKSPDKGKESLLLFNFSIVVFLLTQVATWCIYRI